MKKYILAVLAFVAFGTFAFSAPITKVYMTSGGDKQVVRSGGEVEIQTGGLIDMQAGSTLTINTAAMLNIISTPTFTNVTVTYGVGAATGAFSGALSAATVNTGQGAAEVYLMDQNVRTTDSPAFAYPTVTGISGVTATLSGLLTAGTINTGQGATEVYLMNQNLATTDKPSFAGVTLTSYGTLYSRTHAQLLVVTPTVVGQTAFCSDCVPPKIVVSTGTSLWGEWADAVGAAFK